MKVVVLQTFVDKGFLGYEDADHEKNSIILSFCMKSVKDWCKRNNYQYKLVKETKEKWNLFKHRKPKLWNSSSRKDWELCIQRHEFCLDIDADLLIIIDNDVFIQKDFNLPNVKVGMCESAFGYYKTFDRKIYEMLDRFQIFIQFYNTSYPQGGVQFIDKSFIKHYNEWLINSYKSTEWPVIWSGLEQSHMFAYSLQFSENINWLNYKYNCVPRGHTLKEIRESYAIHFCGGNKANHLQFMEKEMLNKMFGEKLANYLCEYRN